MKEIRHYIKRISDFPKSMVNLETLSPEALWNDSLIIQSNLLGLKKELSSAPWDHITQDKNLLGLHALLCYFFSESEWKEEKINMSQLMNFLQDRLPKLSEHVKPYTEWINDGERTEELVRSLLSYLDLLPLGETKKYFEDRLRSIDTLERIQILEESRKAQERAKEILRKIKQAEEEEAASKYNRE